MGIKIMETNLETNPKKSRFSFKHVRYSVLVTFNHIAFENRQ